MSRTEDPRLLSYEYVQDDSTGWEQVVRVTDHGVLVEDVKFNDIGCVLTQIFDQHQMSKRQVDILAQDLRRREGTILYLMVQSVWARRKDSSQG